MPDTHEIAAIFQKYIAVRRDLHAHPELAFKEQRTAKIVEDHLHALDMEVYTGLAGTGVVGVLDFGPGPFIGIRADMDALPITEQTGVAYTSEATGVMHACGHDGHTSMLLAAAEILASSTGLSGKLAFIFQPAEENEGGARVMVEEGLFKQFPVDMIFALHNMPGVPVGTVKVRSGYISAAFDTVTITIEGQGGHGAMPETTKDPVPASSALVAALNTIVSRNIKPLDGAVVTIGEFGTGPSSFNVIPQKIEMKLSCRSLSEDVQQTIKRRILEVCEGIGIAYDVSINCLYDERYPAVCNAALPAKIALDALSNSQEDYTLITEFDPVMGSEDFAFMAREVPACYFLVGNGDTSGPLHSPTYNFDDAGLEVGASAWVTIAKAALRAKS